MPFDFLSDETLPHVSVFIDGDAALAGAGRSRGRRKLLPSVDQVLATGDYFSRVPLKKTVRQSERKAA